METGFGKQLPKSSRVLGERLAAKCLRRFEVRRASEQKPVPHRCRTTRHRNYGDTTVISYFHRWSSKWSRGADQ